VITLITEFSETIGFWTFTVEEDGKVIHWRPGFRTREHAESVGDAWIRHYLGGIPLDTADDDSC
jgi:hypothetical protein